MCAQLVITISLRDSCVLTKFVLCVTCCCARLYSICGTTVPIYETLGEENVAHVLNETQTKVRVA